MSEVIISWFKALSALVRFSLYILASPSVRYSIDSYDQPMADETV